MEDEKIIELYWNRSEQAIEETQKKYGQYCIYIANQILHSFEDAEECVNDAYYAIWNSIPPQKPNNLKAFLSCITRRKALNRYDYLSAQKRNIEVELSIDEFYECIPSNDYYPKHGEKLRIAINEFLSTLDKRTRIVFVRRYWYCCSLKQISNDLGISENNVKTILCRTRKKMKNFLEI